MSFRIFLGLVLLLIGLGYLAALALNVPFGTIFDTWWPLLIVAFGVYLLIKRPERPQWPLLIVLIGVLLQLRELKILPPNLGEILLAALLIAFGLWLILPRRVGRRITVAHSGGDHRMSEDQVSDTIAFGSGRTVSDSQHFQGGTVNVSFGSSILDLRSATLAPEGAVLDASVTFGQIEIYLPVDWPLVVLDTPSFGACENKTRNPEIPDYATQPGLRLVCNPRFGSIVLKN